MSGRDMDPIRALGILLLVVLSALLAAIVAGAAFRLLGWIA